MNVLNDVQNWRILAQVFDEYCQLISSPGVS